MKSLYIILNMGFVATCLSGCSVTYETSFEISNTAQTADEIAQNHGAIALIDPGALRDASMTLKGFWRHHPSDQALESRGLRHDITVQAAQKPDSAISFAIDKKGLGPIAGFFAGGFTLLSSMIATNGTPYEILDEDVLIIDPQGGSLWRAPPKTSPFPNLPQQDQAQENRLSSLWRDTLIKEEMTLEDLADVYRSAGQDALVQRRSFQLGATGPDRLRIALPLPQLLAQAMRALAQPGQDIHAQWHDGLVLLSNLQPGALDINLSEPVKQLANSDLVAALSIGTLFQTVTITTAPVEKAIVQRPLW